MKRMLSCLFLCLATVFTLLPGADGRQLVVETATSRQPDITHFRLKLRIDEKTSGIEGTEEIFYLASGNSLDLFFLGQRELKIIDVESEPSAVEDFLVDKKSLLIAIKKAPMATPCRFRVRYTARPKEGLYFHRTVTETGIPVEQVWQFEAWEDWMPRPFDPDDRLTWELEADVNAGWRVVSNGKLLEDRTAENRRLFRWSQTVPARFEGFTFVAGNFDVFKQAWKGRDFVHYIPAGVTTASVVMNSLGRVGDMCDVYSREFGYPYPFGDYKQVIIWDYHPWGTEHLGLSCLSENKLIDEPSRLDADDYIVAHELVHTWWAMLIAPTSSRHIWLNEAFGVYFGNQYFESAEGRDEFEYRLKQRMRLYFDEDRKYRRILLTDEPVPGGFGLDEHIYSKGAYILHMLRSWLGDETFFAGLKRYAEAKAYQKADSADLQEAMEEVSGQSLDWHFRQWLDRKGYPVLKVGRTWDAETGRLTVRVEQVQDESCGVYRLPAILQVVTDAGAESCREVFEERSEVRNYKLKGKPLYVRFNADNSLLAAIEFPRPADELIEQLRRSADAQGRIEAIEALAAEADPRAFEALEQALHFDLFHGVRSAAALSLSKKGDSSRLFLLDALSQEKDPRVLKNIISALENFPASPETISALKRTASVPESPYVRARALLALARAKAADAFDMLKAALEENAHRDALRVAAFQGFEILNDLKAVAEIMRYLRSGRTTRWAREPAVRALGALAGKDQEGRRLLEEIGRTDFWPGVREAAKRALEPIDKNE